MIVTSKEDIAKWTQAGAWGDRTLIDYFMKHVKKDPDKVCLVDPLNKEALLGSKPERLTYRELSRAVDATAEGLLSKGIGKDDIVMVQIPNCWELAMLYLAISRTGALISPMPMQWRASELKYIAGLAEAKAIITLEEFGNFKHRELAEQIKADQPSIREIILLPEIRAMAKGPVSGKLDQIKIDPNDIFTLCWSSGTEAEPKGCPLSHNNWIYDANFNYEAGLIKPGDNIITAGPLVNMGSLGTVYCEWLVGGGKLVLHHPFDGPIFIKQLISEEINYTLLVPAVVNAILKHPQVDTFDLSKMKGIAIGAAPPSLWSVQELKRRWGIDFANIWGQNEGTGDIAGGKDIPDMEMRVDHLPYLTKGSKWATGVRKFLEMKIISPETKEIPENIGDVGELWFRGPNVIPCYYKRPDLTVKAFDVEGFFNTGDLFQIRDNDCIGFFDRTKDIIIRGGFNISAQEVENMVLGHPAVLDAAAVAMPDEALGEKVCIYIVTKPAQTISLQEIKSFMQGKGIAVYKMPERLVIIDAIPRNPVGKIMKKVLREDIKKKM